MPAARNKPLRSLQDVNNLLQERLYDEISASSDTNVLVALTGAVAKLNSSAKGNEHFSEPEDEEHRIDNDQLDALSSIQEAQTA